MNFAARKSVLSILGPQRRSLSPAGQAFIEFPTPSGHHYAVPLLSDASFSWLARKLVREGKTVPTFPVYRDCTKTLRAVIDPAAPRSTFHPRVAWEGTHRAYVLNLDTLAGEQIAITAGKWFRSQTSIPFIFDPVQRSMPAPQTGPKQQTLQPLRQLLNLDQTQHETTWNTLVSWMLNALCPPKDPAFHEYSILNLTGHGKTTAAKILAELLDPTSQPIHSLPTTERRLHGLAAVHHILVFDNPGKINPEKSRNLSRLSTGVTSRHKKLEGTLVRPVILTTDEETETRHLAKRIVDVELPAIENVLTPEQIRARLEEIKPQILAALLTLLAENFEKLAPCLPNRKTKNQKIEESVIAFLQNQQGTFQGTMTQLHEALNHPISAKALSLLLEGLETIYLDRHRTKGERQINLRLKKSQKTEESVTMQQAMAA